MSDENPEILKSVEEKQPEADDTEQSPKLFDAKAILALIKKRYEKLEKIKDNIPLKTYSSVLEKLHREEKDTTATLSKKNVEVAKENRPQALPKAFFEEVTMKAKVIRID
jgi:hypothetical protein